MKEIAKYRNQVQDLLFKAFEIHQELNRRNNIKKPVGSIGYDHIAEALGVTRDDAYAICIGFILADEVYCDPKTDSLFPMGNLDYRDAVLVAFTEEQFNRYLDRDLATCVSSSDNQRLINFLNK